MERQKQIWNGTILPHDGSVNGTQHAKTNHKMRAGIGLLALAVVGLTLASGCKTASDSKINPHNWRPPGMLMSLALLALLLATSACSVIRVYDPQSGKVIYESKRLGNSLKIGEVSARSGTNNVIIKGYENDQVQAFKAGVALAEAFISKAP